MRWPWTVSRSAAIAPVLEAEFKNGSTVSGLVRRDYESVTGSIALASGVTVPPGDYWFYDGEVAFAAGRTNLFQPSQEVAGGQFYDGRRLSVTLAVEWNAVPPHLGVGAEYSFNAIRFPDRDLALDTHLFFVSGLHTIRIFP